MAAAALLHVGDDFCHRIPVMEASGLCVVRANCSPSDIRRVFSEGKLFSLVTFHNDLAPVVPTTVAEVRLHTNAPLVLFENPSVPCDERDFDLVIAAQTPPTIWLQHLRMTIEHSRRICDASQRLRTECEEVRTRSSELRADAVHNRHVAFDSTAIWRGRLNADSEQMPGEAASSPDAEPHSN